MDGADSVLGGGATLGETVSDAEALGETDCEGDVEAEADGDAEVLGETDADGVAVTPTTVSALELQYDSEPRNSALIVYLPSDGGVHMRLNRPLSSLVVVPRSIVLPSDLTAVSFTETPWVFVGLATCM